MFKPNTLFNLLVVFSGIIFLSCQHDQNPIEPIPVSQQTEISKATIPFGATIDSAAFFINVTTANSEEVTVHRITNSWEEMSVTWNNLPMVSILISKFFVQRSRLELCDITSL
jgi:hypothetical protein